MVVRKGAGGDDIAYRAASGGVSGDAFLFLPKQRLT